MPARPRPDPPRPALRPPSRRLDAETADAAYRRVLGDFCTGVTVITGADDGRPAGFACQAFAALSLTPPLVVFCPATSSRNLARPLPAVVYLLRRLSPGQPAFSRRSPAAGSASSGSGQVRLPSVWSPDKVGGAGPGGSAHLGRVRRWQPCTRPATTTWWLAASPSSARASRAPLLFYRGRYAAMDAGSDASPPEVVETLLAWPRHADWM